MINRVFICLSVVQIYDLSYIHLRKNLSAIHVKGFWKLNDFRTKNVSLLYVHITVSVTVSFEKKNK